MVGTIKGEDVVLQKILAKKEKVIVMGQVMEANMMVTKDAKDTLSVAATTVESLAHTTTRRTTAVKIPQVKIMEQKNCTHTLFIPGTNSLSETPIEPPPGATTYYLAFTLIISHVHYRSEMQWSELSREKMLYSRISLW